MLIKLKIVIVPVNVIVIIKMKSFSKSELANCAGVTVKTLMNWCKPYQSELESMGWRPTAKILPPHIVKFIVDKFCIDIP